MDFRILGPLEVALDGELLPLGPPRQRALLARLLLDPNHVVTTDRLIEDLWAGDPPESAKHSLHVYVSGLRKCLGDDRSRIAHQLNGYRLTVDPGERPELS